MPKQRDAQIGKCHDKGQGQAHDDGSLKLHRDSQGRADAQDLFGDRVGLPQGLADGLVCF